MNAPLSSTKSRLAKLLTLPLLIALSAALFSGNAERLHARLLWLGESLFTGYFQLQADPTPPPDCDQLFKEKRGAQATKEDDELEDLFADDDDESPSKDTKSGSVKDADEDLEDLFGDDGESATSKAANIQEAQRRAKEQCEEQKIAFVDISKRITPGVRVFRVVEGGVSAFIAWVVEHFKHFLALIFLLGALIASVRDEHISLRPPQSLGVFRLRALTQMVAFGFVTLSTWYYRELLSLPEEKTLNFIWLIGLSGLTLWHGYMLTLRPQFERDQAEGVGGLLAIPLFAIMGWISGIYFFSVGHPTGLAIELTKLTEHSILYVNVALYVWVGMLLKQSSITTQVFDIIRPLRLEPSILAAVVVVGAAIPTAYSGASGIFVIAAGALIYDELRRAGARRHLALAATAMSGSLGVVLSPCLLVVIIASLNKQVTTDELYSWGVWVFLLTAFLFVMISLIQRDRSLPMMGRAFSEAKVEMRAASARLLTPVLTMLVVVALYWLILDTVIDEHSAPMVLPVLLMVLLWREGRGGGSVLREDSEGDEPVGELTKEPATLSTRLGAATSEAGPHIGALLALMGLSICVGGVIERGEVMLAFPESFGSIWLAMSALVLILVVIGMSMDPYGAVILVSATIAEVAYQSGIHPVHFWMVVLVAFELGYLSPPVALNHLLTRQVVGEGEFHAATEEVRGESLWIRHERILLPLLVMGIALVIVAFGPLMFY